MRIILLKGGKDSSRGDMSPGAVFGRMYSQSIENQAMNLLSFLIP